MLIYDKLFVTQIDKDFSTHLLNSTLLTNFSSNDTSNPVTFHMVADRMGFTLLVFTITLNLCHAQSQCNTMETCQLKDTRGTSTASSLIPRSSVYPPRCPVLCSRRAECLATTYDPTTENCELHEVYADGAPCMTLSTNLGSSFSMVKEPGIPCPKVRWTK